MFSVVMLYGVNLFVPAGIFPY